MCEPGWRWGCEEASSAAVTRGLREAVCGPRPRREGWDVPPHPHMTGDWSLLLPVQLFEILAKTPYGHEKKGLFGIEQLLSQGVFRAAFPLHQVRPGGCWGWGRSRGLGPRVG